MTETRMSGARAAVRCPSCRELAKKRPDERGYQCSLPVCDFAFGWKLRFLRPDSQKGSDTHMVAVPMDRNGKLLIKPSKAAIRRIRERLRTETRALRGSNARAVISVLNPVVKGWAALDPNRS